MLTRILNLLIICQTLLIGMQTAQAQDERLDEGGDVSAIQKVCKGENLGQQLHVKVDASQLGVLEYDRVWELLYFNIYKGIELSPSLKLKTSLKGLAFSMQPAKAIEITRLYSMGVYKLELLFVPTKMHKRAAFCEVHKTQTILHIALLRATLLDDKGAPVQAIHTKLGRQLKAQATHAVRNYHNKGTPKVIVEIRGETLTKTKIDKLRAVIKAPLYRCYRQALEKNGRYQGSIIFRFEKGKVRAIHSNKNVIFGNCVTKSIEEKLPINFEKEITFRTIFRLERK